MSKVILVDQDGPLAGFEERFLELWQEKYPHYPAVKLEELKHFYTTLNYPKEIRDKVIEIQTAPGYIRSLPMKPGAREALNEMVVAGHDVRICTTVQLNYKNCVLEKFLWVEDNLGPEWVKKIIMTRDKTMVRGDFLIDDRPQIEGSMTPTWEHVVWDYSYNRHIEARRLSSWSEWQHVLEL